MSLQPCRARDESIMREARRFSLFIPIAWAKLLTDHWLATRNRSRFSLKIAVINLDQFHIKKNKVEHERNASPRWPAYGNERRPRRKDFFIFFSSSHEKGGSHFIKSACFQCGGSGFVGGDLWLIVQLWVSCCPLLSLPARWGDHKEYIVVCELKEGQGLPVRDFC